jgi:hypothetical protein
MPANSRRKPSLEWDFLYPYLFGLLPLSYNVYSEFVIPVARNFPTHPSPPDFSEKVSMSVVIKYSD